MTSEEEGSGAVQQAGVYRIMAWTFANRRMLRLAVLVLGVVFAAGILLLFWSPLAGVLMMLVAASPIILMALVAIAVLVRNEAAAKRARTKDRQ